MKVSTSVLSATENIKETIEKLNQSQTDYLHLDVMDGLFVRENTVDQMDEVLKYNAKPLDIHLMVQEVVPFINKYKEYQPEYITFHIEIKQDILPIIHYIKECDIKVGLSFNPGTDISTLLPYLELADMILVMSVKAGYGGQSFIQSTPDVIKELIILKEKYNYHYEIEVDGGINADTISLVKEVDMVVSGSYIMNGNYVERISNLKEW